MFDLRPISSEPFPHVLVDDYLDANFYRELAASFPECGPNTGPTGYTCFWGDSDYDELVARSPAWRKLFEAFRSQDFIAYALSQFADEFAGECRFDLSNARYVPYLEDRKAKEFRTLKPNGLAPDDLWVRVDMMQGRTGYDRGPHIDHRRRALTMLIYFSDADEIGMEGGDLLLHGDPQAEPVHVRPRQNRMVAFACTTRSFHSVSPITAQARPRNFVQVLLSSSVDLWPDASWPGAEPKRGLRGLAGRTRRFAERHLGFS